MYGLLFGFQITNMFVWRGLTAQVMSFILAEYRSWRPAQVAFLLAAFAAGYVPLQIPYSLLARRTGQKLLCTVNLLAQAAGCALVPAAAAAGPLWLSGVYAWLGVFQGSRVPCHQVLQYRWVPDGMERVRFQQFTTWAGQVVMLLHFSSIPLLAQRVGWRVMPRWYAAQSLAMAGVWHAFAADTPAQWRGPVPMSAEELELLDSIGRENMQNEPPPAPQQPTGAAEPPDAELSDKNLPPLSMGQLFRIREIQGMLAMCVVECTFPTFTKVQALWTLYFVERYGMPMEQVLLRQTALMAPTAVVAALLEGVVETVLIKRGWSTIDIRRRSSSAGYVLQIALKFGEILAPTANVAFAVQFCGVFVGPLHQAGFNLSGREMGGEESGLPPF